MALILTLIYKHDKMKLIEGLKELKRLDKKLNDLRDKVSTHCSHSSLKDPEYGDTQKQKVDEWVQSYHDTVQRMLEIRTAIQRTNLQTEVTIELGEKQVTKSIAEWIYRRRELAHRDQQLYRVMNDNGVQQGRIRIGNSDNDFKEVTVKRYYDPEHRDKMLALYSDEPSLIDAKLEIVNAVTDIVGID